MVGRSKILIIDDNVSMFKTLAFVLKHKGHEVLTASGGLEALELIKQKSFDLIFLDIKMPNMNGIDVFRKIKQIDSKLTVMMMTAYAVEDLIQEALREGASGIIYKPLNIDKVQEKINECMENKIAGLILLVDDDPNFSKTLENILTKRNYKVDIAKTGKKAIALAKKINYDLIIIDMKLPKMNGLEIYLAIKKTNPKIAAIMITAYQDEMDALMEEALNESAYACLKKPLDLVNILRLVEEIWEKKQKNLQLEV